MDQFTAKNCICERVLARSCFCELREHWDLVSRAEWGTRKIFFLAGGAGEFFSRLAEASRSDRVGNSEFQDLREKVAYGRIQEKILHM